MKILGTGLSGLVGSRIVELLQKKYEFENISRSTGVDIVNKEQVLQRISQSEASIILHFAAKTNVDLCEQDKKDGKNGEAWMINVEGTRNIADACSQFNKKLIYASTDFVFDGEKDTGDAYQEMDTPNPINWYGQTKYQAEKLVQNSGLAWVIVRIAYPYRAFFKRTDFVRSIINKFQNKEHIQAVIDHIITPTFIDDIAHSLKSIIEKGPSGILHAVGSQHITPYEAIRLIARTFQLDESLIEKTKRREFFLNRAPRPFNSALKNDKIQKLGVKMKTFEEGLKEVKKQLNLSS